ncbi:cell division protein FtsX [Cytobacillus dafuensis]|uniref:Cell division protein FtsX n=1 Tax=Cytobacillus dafuensis TaxID=1742359 RepID=A0A5B8Z1Y2_CYTDA|nr:permease-like cell division protein FtsX [Cytobacillus dafuensis]QED47034.1 FtsX-like permease family protein [Cytobacillus dafuensis]
MKNILYLFSEARLGLLRNAAPVFAAISIIFISISVLGVSLLIKDSIDHTIKHLNEQVKIRIMVDPKWDTSEMAEVLEKNVGIDSVTIETKKDMVESMGKLFDDKSELLQMFNFSLIPDAITIGMKDNRMVEQMADTLRRTKGVTDVIYPGEYAASIIHWSKQLEKYSLISIIVLLTASILTVMMTINLALLKRKKEVKVKLLMGAKPNHIRSQFLIEGGIIGLLGGILANYGIYLVHKNLFQILYSQLPFVFEEKELNLLIVFTSSLLIGLLLGVVGSFLSTNRMLRYG